MGENESLNDALIECVKACGGSKQVAHKLWPEKTMEAAQRHLLNCLNEDKAERLAPDQVLFLLKMAREKGHHGGVHFITAYLGYTQPSPVEPHDEIAELQRQFIEATKGLSKMAERIQDLQRPNVRAVA
jgi:hypothetical protein